MLSIDTNFLSVAWCKLDIADILFSILPVQPNRTHGMKT